MLAMRRLLPFIVASLIVSACNGSDDDDDMSAGGPPPATPTQRGTLLENPPAKLASYAPADLLGLLGGNDIGRLLVNLIVDPVCTVDVYQLRYQTVGAQNEDASASGALMVPTGTDPACQGPRPIVLYGHGTEVLRTSNIADLPNDAEGLAMAVVFAGQGYIVVAPNYAGYDSSTLTYHPYLNGDQQSKDMIDALTAARSALPPASAPTVTDNGKLFVTGYSQGGYVAMATHRALQAAGSPVTASAPMSGPYALSAFGDAIFQGQVSLSAPLNVTFLVTSYQHAFGNIYTSPTDIFEARYATGIDTLLPGTVDQGDLYAQGKLPEFELFNNVPPDPAFASLTPPTSPENFAALFAKGFGPNNLITNAYRLAYLQDAQANPDGGFPNTTTGLPPDNPTLPFRQALKANDLRNWAPTAPVLLCGGNGDPTVFYFNTQLMQGYWAANAPTAPVTVLDVDSPAGDGDPYANLKSQFAAAKDLIRANAVIGGASDGGDEAVREVYHAGLVPPFCVQAVKSFFDGL